MDEEGKFISELHAGVKVRCCSKKMRHDNVHDARRYMASQTWGREGDVETLFSSQRVVGWSSVPDCRGKRVIVSRLCVAA